MATLRQGSLVRLHSLVSRSELNGHVGSVVGSDAGRSRVAVLVGSETMLLKPSCLGVLPNEPIPDPTRTAEADAE